MDNPQLLWPNATVNADGEAVIEWASRPDTTWLQQFTAVLSEWEGETRGQQWHRVDVYTDYIAVDDLVPEAVPQHKDYTAPASDHATVRVQQNAEREAANAAELERQEQLRAANSVELQRRLREG
jgi:hypothetical protein